FPMDQSSNVLRQISPRVPAFVKHYFDEEPMGSLLYVTNRSELIWRGFPLFVPTIKAVSAPEGDFLVVGLSPLLTPKTNQIPMELLDQIKSRRDLLYYHWEMTQERVFESKYVSQANDLAH